MADPSFNYSYTPTVDHRESNLYIEEYYSSTDTQIYFDDELQTEIGYISYEIQEQLKPVFGYNSRTFDDVVVGNRIVTGQFSVPIKNRGEQEWQPALQLDEDLSSTDTVEQYNQQEETNLQNTDWYGTTKRNIEKDSTDQNIDPDYLLKLSALGYPLNSTSNYNSYQYAIKTFQKNFLGEGSATGLLNNVTKEKIDERFAQLKATPVDLTNVVAYSDMNLKKDQTNLSGQGMMLHQIVVEGTTIAQVIDDKGQKYFVRANTLGL